MSDYTGILGIGLLLVVPALLLAWRLVDKTSRRSGENRLKDRFNVDQSFDIVSSDVAEKLSHIPSHYLRGDGLNGKPDAVFRKSSHYIVGEYKARALRGGPRKREIYQVVLYMGMIKSKRPNAVVEARLAFKDRTLTIEYREAVYQRLQRIRPELLALMNNNGW